MSKKRKRKEKFIPEGSQFYSPRNEEQSELEQAILHNSIIIASGCAGSGKTLFAIQTLYYLYKLGELDSIKIIRLIADTFGERLGALPGEMDQKLIHFLGPIADNLLQVIPEGELEEMTSKGKLEVLPVSHLRGRSFQYTGVLLEEVQNLSTEMILLCLTRIGEGSRFVFTGDPSQVDITGRNGIGYAIDLVDGLDDAKVIHFSEEQVERHPIIRQIINRSKYLNPYVYEQPSHNRY